MNKFEQTLFAFFFGGIAGILLVVSIISRNPMIQSKKLITPEIKLEIVNNKVDTVYVYKTK